MGAEGAIQELDLPTGAAVPAGLGHCPSQPQRGPHSLPPLPRSLSPVTRFGLLLPLLPAPVLPCPPPPSLSRCRCSSTAAGLMSVRKLWRGRGSGNQHQAVAFAGLFGAPIGDPTLPCAHKRDRRFHIPMKNPRRACVLLRLLPTFPAAVCTGGRGCLEVSGRCDGLGSGRQTSADSPSTDAAILWHTFAYIYHGHAPPFLGEGFTLSEGQSRSVSHDDLRTDRASLGLSVREI